MEGDIAVQLHKQAHREGLHYKNVIGDEDSSAIKQIHEQHDADVSKFSDYSHIKRTLYSKLETLQKSHKPLTAAVRQDFVKNFTYALHQNKDKGESSMKRALINIVPHMYGEHDNCGNWCQFDKQENYRHSGLPRGNDLTDKDLRKELEEVIDTYAKNAQKLLTTGDSQANEALNSVAWSKAPKIRNYAGSESFDYRMASAVCQFNDGPEYVSQVIENAGLTPQKITKQHNLKEARRSRYAKMYNSQRSFKRRRIERKKERASKQASVELREGTMYKTNCGESQEEDLDTEYIPVCKGPEKLSAEVRDKRTKVFFDLESTGLEETAEITQISAWHTTDNTFNKYVIPSKSIPKAVSELTGLAIKYVHGERRMFLKDNEVDAAASCAGLSSFIQWLENLPGQEKILLAHNCKRFDMKLLLKALEETHLSSYFQSTCAGFVDTLPLLRTELPGRPSYKLSSIYKDIVGNEFDCHNALADAEALAKIMTQLNIPEERILNYSMTTVSGVDYIYNRKRISENLKVIEDKLCRSGTITKSMAKKICESGLNYRYLKTAHQRDITNGIRAILTEKMENEKPRVTNRKHIINSILNHFNGR